MPKPAPFVTRRNRLVTRVTRFQTLQRNKLGPDIATRHVVCDTSFVTRTLVTRRLTTAVCMNRDALGETRLCVKLSLGNATTACRGACWAMRFATSPAARHGNGRLLKCVDVGARAASRPDRTPTVYTRSLFSVSLLDRSSQSIFYTGSLCLNSA